MSSTPVSFADDVRNAWARESCEFALCCDLEGRITHADSRARARTNAHDGMLIFDLGPEGLQDRLRSFFSRAREEETPDVEVPIVCNDRVETWTFRGKPDGRGGVFVLGREPPHEYRTALRQAEEALAEIVELNRQILRQSREIERQRRRGVAHQK